MIMGLVEFEPPEIPNMADCQFCPNFTKTKYPYCKVNQGYCKIGGIKGKGCQITSMRNRDLGCPLRNSLLKSPKVNQE